jgi:hypothetical protein
MIHLEQVLRFLQEKQETESGYTGTDLTKAINHGNADVIPLIAISRLIDYIRKGKITFDESYYFQAKSIPEMVIQQQKYPLVWYF